MQAKACALRRAKSAHTDPSFIGQVANAEMAGFTANIESAGGAMCAGIVLSPASNSNVAIVFANVHDASGKPIGFVGGATYVDELQSTITGMSAQGLDAAKMYLIGSSDITAATYIFAPDPAMLGAPVEDEAQVQALQQMADVPTSFFKQYEYENRNNAGGYYHYGESFEEVFEEVGNSVDCFGSDCGKVAEYA